MEAGTQTDERSPAIYLVTWGIHRDDSDSSVPLGAFATWESAKAAVEAHSRRHASSFCFYNVLPTLIGATVASEQVLHETRHYSKFFRDTWAWY